MSASIDVKCECGNPNCHVQVTFRRGAIWDKNDKQVNGWMHVDVTDMEGKWIEAMLTPKTARQIMWWAIKNFWRRR